MGQYYKPINIDKQEFVYSHNYGNGLKLMEHSYIGNNFMDVVETLLSPGNRWYKCSLVWAGYYADDEKVIWNGELNELDNRNRNLFDIVETEIKIPETKSKMNYIVNHTKKMFVSKRKIKKNPEYFNFRIHPLSLLTAEGNGRGGGDYYIEDDRIGSWARDIISMEKDKPKGYLEIDGTFKE